MAIWKRKEGRVQGVGRRRARKQHAINHALHLEATIGMA